MTVAHAEAPEKKPESDAKQESAEGEEEEEGEGEAKAEGGEGAEEEEEEEPEDVLPAMQDECRESAKCQPAVKHFQHCTEKVESGKGFKHEDCVEEFVMHCVDNCVAPKLFSKLR
ncbi:Non-heme 11 kDa protein of cytochrome bc1 complex [Rickenella mellea]|uniref:Non-heme 11 kDa protein of cytochrome bc1 complex n=1 Tax=Rickenella mellea TaxID=50990 RepID=A0A4Y7QIB6_9AGAM|nr:Non-heme 11 kDa protein of cytochrome bc1 complex [Rickenella mellea]